LTASAAAGTNTIKLNSTEYVGVGDQYPIEQGGTTEWVTVTAVNAVTKVVTVTGEGAGGNLANTFLPASGAALIWPLGGLSSNGASPIFIEDAGSDDAIRAIMTHEIGHTTGRFKDLSTRGHVMYYSTDGFGDAIRYRALPKRHEAGDEKQWDMPSR
jgi:hypothetical protein